MKLKLIFLLVILAANISYASEKFPLTTEHYHLSLSFDFNKETLQGRCEIEILNHSGQNVEEVPLILYRLMKVDSVYNHKKEKLAYEQSVVQITDFPKLQVNAIRIKEGFQAGETKKLTIYYSGYLLGSKEVGMIYLTDRISRDFTLIRNDAFSFPWLGKPEFAQILNNLPVFEYDIEVSVPSSLVVANGGKLIEKTILPGDQVLYRFSSKMPGHRIDIAIAPYEKIHEGRLEVYYLNDSLAAVNIADKGTKALELYSKWWGELMNENTLTIIETEKGSGGQADPAVILLPEEGFTKNNNYGFLYHELSHLWNVKIQEASGLSPRWEEGLATFYQYYMEELIHENKAGLTINATNGLIKRLKSNFDSNPLLPKTPLIEFGNHSLTRHSYTQGMILFSVLFHWQGQDTFNKVIGGFYSNYYTSGASTRDFTNYWMKLAGTPALESFFQDWIYSTGYTTFIIEGKSLDEMIDYYKGKQ